MAYGLGLGVVGLNGLTTGLRVSGPTGTIHGLQFKV